MNSTATYTEPVNRIKQRILFDDNLSNMACLCHDWADFLIEIEEWGIYKLGGVDCDTLTKSDIVRLHEVIKTESSQEAYNQTNQEPKDAKPTSIKIKLSNKLKNYERKMEYMSNIGEVSRKEPVQIIIGPKQVSINNEAETNFVKHITTALTSKMIEHSRIDEKKLRCEIV